jgi:hypothetical protein
MDIATVKLPAQRGDIRNLLLASNTISQLAHLHKNLCKPIKLYDNMTDNIKVKKRDIEQVEK